MKLRPPRKWWFTANTHCADTPGPSPPVVAVHREQSVTERQLRRPVPHADECRNQLQVFNAASWPSSCFMSQPLLFTGWEAQTDYFTTA